MIEHTQSNKCRCIGPPPTTKLHNPVFHNMRIAQILLGKTEIKCHFLKILVIKTITKPPKKLRKLQEIIRQKEHCDL